MKEDIVQELLCDLNRIRGDSAYWFPFAKLNDNVPVIAYDIEKIYAEDRIDLLENIMKACNIDLVTTVQLDHGLVFEGENINALLHERDEDGYEFPRCVETYYFDETKQWLIYVSHEGTITFTGEAIVLQAKNTIPEKYLY